LPEHSLLKRRHEWKPPTSGPVTWTAPFDRAIAQHFKCLSRWRSVRPELHDVAFAGDWRFISSRIENSDFSDGHSA
jgi:hypothetical protein